MQHKTLDIVTLFHKPSSAASVRVANALKQISANATSSATEDQASDHTPQTNAKRQQLQQFELDITDKTPTTDQLKTILDYIGKANIHTVIEGATTHNEAMKRFIASPETTFKRPVVRLPLFFRQWAL